MKIKKDKREVYEIGKPACQSNTASPQAIALPPVPPAALERLADADLIGRAV